MINQLVRIDQSQFFIGPNTLPGTTSNDVAAKCMNCKTFIPLGVLPSLQEIATAFNEHSKNPCKTHTE